MTDALKKVDTPLMERYETTCSNCRYERQFFGTHNEALKSALNMGWEFRHTYSGTPPDGVAQGPDRAFCPHCKLLVKA